MKYDTNQVYLAVMYGDMLNATPISGSLANNAQKFEAVAHYPFLNGILPSLGYVSSKSKTITQGMARSLYKEVASRGDNPLTIHHNESANLR